MDNKYKPNSTSPTGETLVDILKEQNISKIDLCDRSGISPSVICDIIQGKPIIDKEIAQKLEVVLNISADFWIKRDARYKEYILQKIAKDIAQKISTTDTISIAKLCDEQCKDNGVDYNELYPFLIKETNAMIRRNVLKLALWGIVTISLAYMLYELVALIIGELL